MSTQGDPANIGKVLSFLREWDRGDRTVRSRMLSTFLGQNTGKSFYELDRELAQLSSLFLARLTTWMRLTYPFLMCVACYMPVTAARCGRVQCGSKPKGLQLINSATRSFKKRYMFGTFLGLQLRAISIFLSASGHDQYLMEFLEDGGALTLLDILNYTQSKEEDKAEALHLLLTVSNAGRKYKEIICESRGVKVIAECLAESDIEETQETAWALLESLCQGNPKYQNQIYRSLITLMACNSPKAQQLVLHTLHTIQSKTKTAHHSIVEPLLNMLRSLHLEVQDEESEMIKMTGSLPVFVQQAAAAKAIRLLAEEDHELSRELLSLGVIQYLLYAMGNREHTDAQIQASLALEHFVRSFPVVEEHVQRVMGSTLFAAFMHKAGSLYMNLDETQAEILLTNKVNISGVLDGENSEG